MARSRQTDAQLKRRREMDLIGMLIVVGLVFFHTAQVFRGSEHYVENTQQGYVAVLAANLFLAFGNMWGMPLMMFIAGTAIWYSLRKRTAGQFLLNRVRRLFVPFVTGVVLVFPPVMWLTLKFHLPSSSENYWQFLGRYFDVRFSLSAFPGFLVGVPPDSLWNTGHLWFLIYLFVYTLLLLPLFWYLSKPSGQSLVERFVGFWTRPWAIYLLALPIGLIEAYLLTEAEGAWNRLVWPFFIFYGFLLACDREFGRALQRHRKSAIVLGIFAFLIYFAGTGYLLVGLGASDWTDTSAVGLLVRFSKGMGSWFWLVAIMGIAGQMGQRGTPQDRSVPAPYSSLAPPPLEAPRRSTWVNPLADYAKEAQLPFYVLHETPLIALGFYVVQWQVNALVKYVVIVLGALVATLVIYDIAVRRTPPTRLLFGLRPGKTNNIVATPPASR